MQRTFALLLVGVLLLTIAGCGNGSPNDPDATREAAPRRTVAPIEPDADHRAEIQKFRSGREARLQRADGWLSLVGPAEGHLDFARCATAPPPPGWYTLGVEGRQIGALVRAAGRQDLGRMLVSLDEPVEE